MKISGETPDRPLLINIIVLIVITASMVAVPIRKVWRERNEPAQLAPIRGHFIAQAFDKIAITNRESAAGILRCVDPTLERATLPGMPPSENGPAIAWNVVDLPPDASRELPLLISRNIRADSLASLTGRVADAIADEPPFGTNYVIIIFRSGRASLIQGDALAGTWIPYLGSPPPTNRILRP